jgi:hypothetical protein
MRRSSADIFGFSGGDAGGGWSGGGPAIGASPEVWEPIEQAVLAAVQVDPAARAHLFGPRPRLARH